MRHKRVVGVLLGLIIIGFFVAFSGIENVIILLQTVSVEYILMGVSLMVVALLIRAAVWYGLFYLADVSVSATKITSVYVSSLAIKSTVPVGYVAAQSVIAYIMSKNSYLTTERTLSIITLADIIIILPYYTIGAIAFILLMFRGQIPEAIGAYIIVGAIVSVVMLGVFFLFWRKQELMIEWASALTQRLKWFIERSEWLDGQLLTPQLVEEKLSSMYDTMNSIFDEPKEVFVLFSLSHLSVLAFIGVFMISGLAIGVGMSLAVASVIVVLSRLGVLVPLPGGIGGVESIIVMATTLLLGVSLAEATAIALVYRVLSYWLIIGAGGLLSTVTPYTVTVE